MDGFLVNTPFSYAYIFIAFALYIRLKHICIKKVIKSLQSDLTPC